MEDSTHTQIATLLHELRMELFAQRRADIEGFQRANESLHRSHAIVGQITMAVGELFAGS